MDARNFQPAQEILNHLNIKKIRLLTNNPEKISGLQKAGIDIIDRVPLHVGENAENEHYLATKAAKLGHLFFNK